MCGVIEWDNDANIGYSAGGDPYDNHDPSSNEVACVNSPDSDWNNVVYQISTATPEDPPPGIILRCITEQIHCTLPVLLAHIVEDVRITNITGSSAEITWTVPSLSTTQDYVVEYGEDEDDLDLSTDPITVTDTTLIDQMYTVTLEGLSQSVLYYVCVATTDPEGATFYSETKSFRTIQTGIPQG